jgi:hypothetical protein
MTFFLEVAHAPSCFHFRGSRRFSATVYSSNEQKMDHLVDWYPVGPRTPHVAAALHANGNSQATNLTGSRATNKIRI